jgi:hypothetical protein
MDTPPHPEESSEPMKASRPQLCSGLEQISGG